MTKVKDHLQGLSVLFLRDGKRVYASADSGLKPILDAMAGECGSVERAKGFAGCDALDKIVGKAAAVLYVLLGIRSVGACVMTHKAKELLNANGIDCYADEYTDGIINRAGDGLCPMETAVADIDDLDEALKAIRKKLEELSAGHNKR